MSKFCSTSNSEKHNLAKTFSILYFNSISFEQTKLFVKKRPVETSTHEIEKLFLLTNNDPKKLNVFDSKRFSSTIDEQKYVFTTADSYAGVIDNTGRFVIPDVQLNQGVRLIHKYTVDSSNKEQQFILPNTNTDVSTLSVVVKASSSSTETHKVAG